MQSKQCIQCMWMWVWKGRRGGGGVGVTQHHVVYFSKLQQGPAMPPPHAHGTFLAVHTGLGNLDHDWGHSMYFSGQIRRGQQLSHAIQLGSLCWHVLLPDMPCQIWGNRGQLHTPAWSCLCYPVVTSAQWAVTRVSPPGTLNSTPPGLHGD